MASIKQQIRTHQALQVIRYSNSGMSIIEACKKAGIARSTFYYFIYHHPEAITAFQEMQMIANLEQFQMILDNQMELLGRVIQDGKAETTRPRQRLKIYQYIVERSDELHQLLKGMSISGDNTAADFLNGPKLVPGKSRMTS